MRNDTPDQRWVKAAARLSTNAAMPYLLVCGAEQPVEQTALS